jgi:CHAT domain-containing protein
MRLLSIVSATLFVLPLITSAQTNQREIKNAAELATALCSAEQNEKTRDALLTSYPQLANTLLWEEVNRRAAGAYYDESPTRALAIYDISIEVATKLAQPELLAKTYYNLARTFSGINQTDNSIDAYTKSSFYFERAGLKRDLIYVLADLGMMYFNKENYQSAKEYSERSISIADSVASSTVPAGSYPDDFGRAQALQTLAEIDLRNGDHDDAIQKLNRSLELYHALKNQGDYTYYLAAAYSALGKVYPEIGDYRQALLNLNRALDMALATRNQNMVASVLNSIGYLYLEEEDYGQAKQQFDRSLKLYEVVKNEVEGSRVLLNLGVVEQRQAHLDEAIVQFKLALTAAKASQNIDVQIAAGEGIGVVLTAQRKFTDALTILNESLGAAKRNESKTREVELEWRIAQTLFETHGFGEAAGHAEAAVRLAQSVHLPKLEYLATTTLGQVYSAQGKLEPAKEQLVRATRQLETLRDQVAGPETASQLYFENKLTSYHALVDILAQQEKPIEALLYAERAKARVLLDVVSGNKRDFSKSLTPAEKDQQLRLNRKIADLNERTKRSFDAAGDPIYSQLDNARLEYQAFQDSIYITHPDLRRRSGRTTELSAAEVRDLTATDTAYLEYVVTRSKVWLFVLTKDPSNSVAQIRSYQLGIEPRELLNNVNLFHDRLANRHPEYASLALELYRVLLSPAEIQLRHTTFCIVPDTFLWNLPFQALMTRDGHFLIEDHSLYYAPSLSVLREMKRKSSTNEKTDASLIAFGNPVIGKDEQRNEELCPLPEAEAEVKSIAGSFSPQGRRVFVGREATEKTFRTLAPTYSTIHLATHGIIDNRQPLYSHLLLTKSEGDPENDGLLEAREIMNMKLRANLAVLSACETANGTISPGEGVVGMSWAFFAAGTRSMLVSQWKVNSASTSQLMVHFYKILESPDDHSDGRTTRALQNAALSLMKDRSYHHPFYWAGFVMIGR